jgi:3-oxoacyl-[acyl-carrier protein] reductase
VKIAVVTGAGRGIGRAVALSLARRGWDLALLSRTASELMETQALILEEGQRAVTFSCDVSKPDEVRAAKTHVCEELGAPEIVVCAAGIVRRSSVWDTTDDDFDHVIRVNLHGVFYCARAFIPAMRDAHRGRFVVVSSISATLGSPQQSAYAASKWGVDGFMKSLAEELRGSGVAAMSVRPGAVDTRMLQGSPFQAQMSADDVANLITYACLDAPLAMNASAIDIFGP